MWRVVFAALSGLLWGLFVTPLTMRLAARYRVVDHPGGRKRHQDVMPRGGGLALWSGCVLWSLFAQTGDISVDVTYMGFAVESANPMGGGGGCCGCASGGSCASAQ